MRYYYKIIGFVAPYKWWLSLSLLFSFLYVIMNTASLWMVSSLISSILNPSNFSSTSNNSVIAYLEILTLEIIGDGGHGARPHQAVDAIWIAARVINGLQDENKKLSKLLANRSKMETYF